MIGNHVTLIGNLGQDPEVKPLNDDNMIATFSLAVKKMGKDRGPSWLTCKAFRKQAEIVQQYCQKGKQVAVEGYIDSGSYDKDGETKYYTHIVVQGVQLLGRKDEAQDAKAAQAEPRPFNHAENIPF